MNKKGYKVVKEDMSPKHGSMEFKVNKWYSVEGDVRLCYNGYHYCPKLVDCFSYYDFNPKNRVFEIEAKGATDKGADSGDKWCSRSIRLVRELSWHEVLELVNIGKRNTGSSNSGSSNSGYSNSGDRNSGDSNSGDRNSGNSNSGSGNSGNCNSGYRNSGNCNSGNRNSGSRNSGSSNSGDCNSGYWNSGYRNSGSCNSGYWNSCNYETGFFNSQQSDTVNIFNKPCKRSDWNSAIKPDFIYNITLTKWESDSSIEGIEGIEGKLVTIDYKEAWKIAYKNASDRDIELLKALPNFDAKVFEEITGIKVKG